MANPTSSLAHTKWMCKYHIVFIPKYRRKVIYNQYRADLQEIIRTLCKYKGVEILEGHMMPDHALFPFKYSIKLDTLIFGGILISRCTWSDIICPSSISTPLYLHRVRIISCKSARYWLYMIFLLYFGTNTMWYLQTHLVWDKLFVWFAILFSFRVAIDLCILLYHIRRFFGITFCSPPA